MAITETPTGWTFDHGNETYGPFATRDSAAMTLYDLERRAISTEQVEHLAATYAVLDETDRPFADVITAWMDRVDEEFKPLAIAGCMLLEAAAFGTTHAEKVKAGVDGIMAAAEDDDEVDDIVVASFVQGYMQGKEDTLARIEQHLREKQETEQQPA